jgi:hypothetical protein
MLKVRNLIPLKIERAQRGWDGLFLNRMKINPTPFGYP